MPPLFPFTPPTFVPPTFVPPTFAVVPRDWHEPRLTPRTLILIRWVAIAGQLISVLTVHFELGLALPLMPALVAIGALAVVNLGALIRRRGRRMSEAEAAGHLAFDVIQLAALLYLTGGLDNPFAMLILAPITVAATILSRGLVVLITLLGLVSVGLLSIWHLPLPWGAGAPPKLPPLYVTGAWIAFTLACVFLAAYCWSVASEARRMSAALAATQMALAREQKMSALGALAAAAAHELGSPLSTIAVVARELDNELPVDSPISEDVRLILSQTERCRKILAELARAPDTEDPDLLQRIDLLTYLGEIGSPYARPGVRLDVHADAGAQGPVPLLLRRPELLHGLGNILQNAIHFAASRVDVTVTWDEGAVRVEVRDDGPGYPPGLLGRIGEPYISQRSERGGHQGLGLFIAMTLLERSGARLSFANGRAGGAEVTIRWARRDLTAAPAETERGSVVEERS